MQTTRFLKHLSPDRLADVRPAVNSAGRGGNGDLSGARDIDQSGHGRDGLFGEFTLPVHGMDPIRASTSCRASPAGIAKYTLWAFSSSRVLTPITLPCKSSR